MSQSATASQGRQNITVLGATGSIGASTLDVIRLQSEFYQVFALTANSRVAELLELVREFKPVYAVVMQQAAAKELASCLAAENISTEVLCGVAGLEQVASDERVHMVMAAIVGAAGLAPTLAAAQAGKRVLLANKEALVMAGPLFMQAIQDNNAELLPIDSEHNAIFQCFPHKIAPQQYNHQLVDSGIRKILLTASGGPFRGKSQAELANITPAQAVAHPNWSMGQKISVDSASLMNKGLELIEACFLFNCQPEQVQVVVHKQSVIHSMVQYIDGSLLAQLGQPDMKTPIAYGMSWPNRMESGVADVDIFAVAQLDFEQPDHETFPCLKLAEQAFLLGGCAPAVLNAANEVVVEAFLREQTSFLAIPQVIEQVLEAYQPRAADTLQDVLQADQWAREQAAICIQQLVS